MPIAEIVEESIADSISMPESYPSPDLIQEQINKLMPLSIIAWIRSWFD